jgi:hypothetical protein
MERTFSGNEHPTRCSANNNNLSESSIARVRMAGHAYVRRTRRDAKKGLAYLAFGPEHPAECGEE